MHAKLTWIMLDASPWHELFIECFLIKVEGEKLGVEVFRPHMPRVDKGIFAIRAKGYVSSIEVQ